MSPAAPEFSRLVPLAPTEHRPFRQRIEATAEEREKLSRRFDLISLDRLVAEVELRRQSAEVVLLEADFEAEFEQCCAVTLEPVRGAVSDRFSLVYGPAPDGGAGNRARAATSRLSSRLDGDAIDIGEAVAQEFSLALAGFPRDPDAGSMIGNGRNVGGTFRRAGASPEGRGIGCPGMPRARCPYRPWRRSHRCCRRLRFLANYPLPRSAAPPHRAFRWPFPKRRPRHRGAICGARIMR